jgi:hypothetical protein
MQRVHSRSALLQTRFGAITCLLAFNRRRSCEEIGGGLGRRRPDGRNGTRGAGYRLTRLRHPPR